MNPFLFCLIVCLQEGREGGTVIRSIANKLTTTFIMYGSSSDNAVTHHHHHHHHHHLGCTLSLLQYTPSPLPTKTSSSSSSTSFSFSLFFGRSLFTTNRMETRLSHSAEMSKSSIIPSSAPCVDSMDWKVTRKPILMDRAKESKNFPLYIVASMSSVRTHNNAHAKA